ncbi:hypothetical protein MUP77_16110 [Candidatus Bathyarchaeota archaeon]|nr:hypothetical protein [Candidatus Bathyarchaeota archaeon]
MNVPDKCPLKLIVESLTGTSRRPFSCAVCMMNCPLHNQKREMVLTWRPRKWIIDYSDEFIDYITNVKSKVKQPKRNPYSKIITMKMLEGVTIKGFYTQVRNSIKYYFDMDWDPPMYDFIASVVMNSYSDIKPSLKVIS